jgi:hypothetical protein
MAYTNTVAMKGDVTRYDDCIETVIDKTFCDLFLILLVELESEMFAGSSMTVPHQFYECTKIIFEMHSDKQSLVCVPY